MYIPISKTTLNKNDIELVSKTLESGWIVQGKNIEQFEKEFCKFTKSKHSIAVTSCTTALYLSLVASNFTHEDEAIVPAFTWISSANVIEHLGGKVKFCDIDINTFNIDPKKIEQCITKKTKVIIVVHLFGMPANMDEIIKIANKYKITIIEDAACGLGSFYKNIHVGNFGITGCFSFHPRKSVTTGEGGMITTNDSKLAEKIRILRDHGAQISDFQRHYGAKPYILPEFPMAGYNFRMTDIQGALGFSQMQRIKKILDERIKIAKKYDSELSNLSWLKIPSYNKYIKHGYQSYPCFFNISKISENNINLIHKIRNTYMEKLEARGIATRPATHAVHMLKYYKEKYNLSPMNYPNAFIANQCSISFPLYNGLKTKEQNFIINNIKLLYDF